MGAESPVSVTPVTDPAVIAEVSQAYLPGNMRPARYANEMVRAEILPTTVRLDPR